MPEPETQELRIEQARREREAHERAKRATDPREAHAEQRREERASYLRAKLDERADSEEDA